MQDPGHSGLESIDVVVIGIVVVIYWGLGLAVVAATRVLSQQTEPFLQSEVLGISTDGRSQNAIMIMFGRQYPGQRGPKSGVVVLGVVEVVINALPGSLDWTNWMIKIVCKL